LNTARSREPETSRDTDDGGACNCAGDHWFHFRFRSRPIIPELPARNYSVSVVASGFSPSAANIRLAVDEAVRAGFYLPIATRQESAAVDVRISALQTETSDLSQSLDRSTIDRLPLNRRGFLQLALLTPGESVRATIRVDIAKAWSSG
jgi:hypothetical protein